MAIYSFNHDTFGRTTNRAGAAGDNAAYNSREDATRLDDHERPELSAADNAAYNAREEAVYAIRSHIIPPEASAAEAWFREQERNERKNARMSDRFIAALPRELTPDQCIEAVEGFCRAVTGDRVPWHFALHLELEKRDNPDWNPHTHIIFRDRDIESGRRVLYTSAGPKERRELDANGIDYWTTKDFRVAWNDHLNRALERAGHECRVDHRSLKEQGIDRQPGIHIGPGSQNAADKGHGFESRDIHIGARTIPYTVIDDGTRAEHAARIKAANESPQLSPTTPRAIAAESDQVRLREGQRAARFAQRQEQDLDRAALRDAHKAEARMHRAWAKSFAADERRAGVHSAQEIRAITNTAWGDIQALHAQDRKDLGTAHKMEAAALSRAHAAERLAVSARTQAESLQSHTNVIAGETRAGMAAQQANAARQMQAHQAERGTPFERAREMTATANGEHELAESLRSKLAAQRQTNRLIANEPDAQAGRAMAALRRVIDAAALQPEHAGPSSPGRSGASPDASRGARTAPFSVLDPAMRAQHAAAEQSWQAREASASAGQCGDRGHLARAQAQERKVVAVDQTLDRAALRDAHKAERQALAGQAKALAAEARQAALKEVRAAIQPKWQAVRSLGVKTHRAEAAKRVTAEHKALYADTAEKAMAQVRSVTDPARIALDAVHARDRKELSETHGLESAALARVHASERMADRTRAPAIAAAASSQRDLLIDLRGRLNTHRRTCRFLAGAGPLSRPQAERAIAALRTVVAADQQKQQRADAVARGMGSEADRANASPQARERADRSARADQQRKIDVVISTGATPGKGRKGGGRGR